MSFVKTCIVISAVTRFASKSCVFKISNRPLDSLSGLLVKQFPMARPGFFLSKFRFICKLLLIDRL